MTPTLRLLPLGGRGETGKNMTVVEYDGRIVVIDAGVRFPTAEMHGIDGVVPDFTYRSERADTIEAIVITHGHEDHLDALPWILRKLPNGLSARGLRPAADRRHGAIQTRRAQAQDADQTPRARHHDQGGPLLDRAGGHVPLDPRRGRSRAHDVGTVLFTDDHRLDQTPVDGKPNRHQSPRALRRRRLLLLCGDSTNTDRPGFELSEADVGPKLREVFGACGSRIIVTSFASNIHRVQQVIDIADQLGRRVALLGRSMVIPDAELVIITTGARPGRSGRALTNGGAATARPD